MSCFNGLKLTKLGEILLANINGNLNETLTFTSGAVGAGAIRDDNEINSLTALKDKWKDLDILSIEKDEDDETIVKLELQFSNVDLQEAKLFREIGIYAKGNNGEPVLFAYSNAGENYDYVPLPKDNPQTFTIQINLKITSNSKIDAIINMAGFVTIGKMVEFLKSKLTQIPTVIELQSKRNLKVGDIVEVLGYYTAGDGAGHKRIIANEDDGSGVQLVNKLWANIVHNGEVNVSWFGAKGDGITDDTEFIQKALNYNIDSNMIIIFDIEVYTNKINIPANRILTGKTINAIQIKIGKNVTLKELFLQPKETKENIPFILIIGKEVKQMANINIKNITIPKTISQINRDFFCLDVEGNTGIFGITIDGICIPNLVDFNTVFKFKMHKSKNRLSDFPWITYFNLRNLTMLGSKNMIEILSYYDEDQDEYAGMYMLEDSNVAGFYAFKIQNCHFESQGRAETFMRFNNNTQNIHIDENSYIGDYLQYDSGRNNKNKYYIIDLRGKNKYYDNRLKVLPFYENKYKDYITILEDEKLFGAPNKLSSYSNAILDFKSNYALSKDTERTLLNFNIWGTKKIYLILSSFGNFDTMLSYIINGSKSTDGNIPNLTLNFLPSTNKYIFTTNIPDLKKVAIYTNNERKFLVLPLDINNSFGNEFSRFVITSFVEYYTENLYYVINGSNPEDADIQFSELGLVLDREIEKALAINEINTPYMATKMQQEGVYNDYVTYNDEKIAYDKQQKKLEQDRQLAYEEALKTNPNLTYEEWLSAQPVTLAVNVEPQPSENLKKFMDKYL